MRNQPPNTINQNYLQQIKKSPILTLDEEYQLAKRWREKEDPEAIEKLVTSHLRLVAKIASGYRGYGLPLNDLISEGSVGMMQAMKHFDPERGFRLSTYAMWWIRAAIQEYILHSWSLVKIGTTAAQKKLFFRLKREKRAVMEQQQAYLSEENVEEIAKNLGVRESDVWQMTQRLSAQDHSLNAPVRHSGEEGETEWVDWLEDEQENQETQLMEQDEIARHRALLEKALTILTPRERLILRERRLVDSPKTLETLSVELNISRERVRQIEVKAFGKLQRAMRLAKKPQH